MRSGQDSRLLNSRLTTLFLGILPQAFYQYFVHILPKTDTLLFLNQHKREAILHKRTCRTCRVNLESICILSGHAMNRDTVSDSEFSLIIFFCMII